MKKDTTKNKSLVKKKLTSIIIIAIVIFFALKEFYEISLTSMEVYIAYVVAAVLLLLALLENIPSFSKRDDESIDVKKNEK